jgi:mannitol-1-/sugar-/sorbitol-6-phosphatase
VGDATGDAAPRARASAVLFDLDGVLVDSLLVVEQAWRRWAREQDLPADEVLAVVHGRTAREVIGMLAPQLDAAEQAALVGGYEAQHRGQLTALPGARECVGIACQGRWAVVTSGARALAVSRLAAVGLPVPEVLVTADDVTFGKPDPEPYRRAAAALGVPVAQCVVVEDAPMGVLAAKRAGMTVLAVTTTHPAGALGQADQVFAGMADVSGWLSARGPAERTGAAERTGLDERTGAAGS